MKQCRTARSPRSLQYALLCGVLVAALALPVGSAFGQTEDYVFGVDKRLQIKVHVLGEVESPGEYQVSDDTNVLELISKAGGPTEYASVRNVIVKRAPETESLVTEGGRQLEVPLSKQILKIDLEDYLSDERARPLPVLQPGDVVAVPRNKMHRWKTIFGMVRDISVVASAYFLYLRATD